MLNRKNKNTAVIVKIAGSFITAKNDMISPSKFFLFNYSSFCFIMEERESKSVKRAWNVLNVITQ